MVLAFALPGCRIRSGSLEDLFEYCSVGEVHVVVVVQVGFVKLRRRAPDGLARHVRSSHATFEQAIVESVSDRIKTAMTIYMNSAHDISARRLVAAGGVAANARLRAALAEVAEEHTFSLHVPPLELCGDNAAMIAWAGAERLARGMDFEKDFAARARWPLDEQAPRAIGAGVKA